MSYVYGFGQAPPRAPRQHAAPRHHRAPGPAVRRHHPGHWRRPGSYRPPPVVWGYPYPAYQPAIYEPVVVMPPDPFVEACEAVGGAYARGICWLPDGSTRTREQGMAALLLSR